MNEGPVIERRREQRAVVLRGAGSEAAGGVSFSIAAAPDSVPEHSLRVEWQPPDSVPEQSLRVEWQPGGIANVANDHIVCETLVTDEDLLRQYLASGAAETQAETSPPSKTPPPAPPPLPLTSTALLSAVSGCERGGAAGRHAAALLGSLSHPDLTQPPSPTHVPPSPTHVPPSPTHVPPSPTHVPPVVIVASPGAFFCSTQTARECLAADLAEAALMEEEAGARGRPPPSATAAAGVRHDQFDSILAPAPGEAPWGRTMADSCRQPPFPLAHRLAPEPLPFEYDPSQVSRPV